MSNYLAHHGILGQKWGKKNGPPYPLDYKKLSEEERSQAKDSAIRRGDVEEAQYNREYFTDDEVRQVINRFNLNQSLSSLASPKQQSTFDKVENFINKADRAAKMLDNGIDTWNTVAKISNGMGLTKPKELPVIDKRDPWNKPKNEKKDRVDSNYEMIDGKLVRTSWKVTDTDGNTTNYKDNTALDAKTKREQAEKENQQNKDSRAAKEKEESASRAYEMKMAEESMLNARSWINDNEKYKTNRIYNTDENGNVYLSKEIRTYNNGKVATFINNAKLK